MCYRSFTDWNARAILLALFSTGAMSLKSGGCGQVWAVMEAAGMEARPAAYVAMLRVLISTGRYKEAQRLFRTMQAKQVPPYLEY